MCTPHFCPDAQSPAYTPGSQKKTSFLLPLQAIYQALITQSGLTRSRKNTSHALLTHFQCDEMRQELTWESDHVVSWTFFAVKGNSVTSLAQKEVLQSLDHELPWIVGGSRDA